MTSDGACEREPLFYGFCLLPEGVTERSILISLGIRWNLPNQVRRTIRFLRYRQNLTPRKRETRDLRIEAPSSKRVQREGGE